MVDKAIEKGIKKRLNAYRFVRANAENAEKVVRTLEAKRDLSDFVRDSTGTENQYYSIDNDPEYAEAKKNLEIRDFALGKIGDYIKDNLEGIAASADFVEAVALGLKHDEKTDIGKLFGDYALYTLATSEPTDERQEKRKEAAYKIIVSRKLKGIIEDGIRERHLVPEDEVDIWASLATLCVDETYIEKAISKQYNKTKEKIKGINKKDLVAYVKKQLGDRPEAYISFAENLDKEE